MSLISRTNFNVLDALVDFLDVPSWGAFRQTCRAAWNRTTVEDFIRTQLQAPTMEYGYYPEVLRSHLFFYFHRRTWDVKVSHMTPERWMVVATRIRQGGDICPDEIRVWCVNANHDEVSNFQWAMREWPFTDVLPPYQPVTRFDPYLEVKFEKAPVRTRKACMDPTIEEEKEEKKTNTKKGTRAKKEGSSKKKSLKNWLSERTVLVDSPVGRNWRKSGAGMGNWKLKLVRPKIQKKYEKGFRNLVSLGFIASITKYLRKLKMPWNRYGDIKTCAM